MKDRITFLIFTYNEARRIEYILRCFLPYGNVVVMDNHSTDNTVEIVERMGGTVYQHDHPGYVEEESVAANALSKVKTDWVYWGYADELLPKTVLTKMQEVVVEGRYTMVRMPRKNLHYGVEKLNFDSGGAYPRFFRKEVMDFAGTEIHHFGRFVGKEEDALTLPVCDGYSVYHCSTYNLQKFEIAHSKYSDIEALRGSFSPVRIFTEPVKWFIKWYFLRGAWKSGWAGFIMVMQYVFFFFNLQAKRWERENGITLESIEENYDRVKERLLRE
ncbi:putative glycosyltransferase [Geobacter sp. OR-1]|uniref:glycosyltransferase family 2 protein n=1 Tax=Geobacter sp. OR-1 TaxID=1266765 RepID=UPI000543CE80|nr:glycosyltransferase family 2 protein [Geobacter sp. OR-1]GAM11005.1 putative glycosyltransferase [Geobacter sp. OR-1]